MEWIAERGGQWTIMAWSWLQPSSDLEPLKYPRSRNPFFFFLLTSLPSSSPSGHISCPPGKGRRNPSKGKTTHSPSATMASTEKNVAADAAPAAAPSPEPAVGHPEELKEKVVVDVDEADVEDEVRWRVSGRPAKCEQAILTCLSLSISPGSLQASSHGPVDPPRG